MLKKAVGYLRVSTPGQAAEDRYGLEEQESLISEYAEANGYSVDDWYTDGGVSGVKEDRPAMNALLYGDIQNPPIEAVIVAKSDRIARDIKLYYYYMMLLEKKGIALISATEPVVNDDTGLGSIYHALMLFVAEQERKNILMRTMLGKQKKGAAGGFIGGRTPFGYYAKDKELEIEEREAGIVRKIFALRREGYSIPQITAALIDGGDKTRSNTYFTVGYVGHILDNEARYRGLIERDGKIILAKHTAILDDLTYAPKGTGDKK